MPHTGSCLCGQSHIAISGPSFTEQIACHCTDCQLTSGSAHSTNILPKITDVKAGVMSCFITGAFKQYDSKAASGNTVSRVFCGNCGAALAHKAAAFGDCMAVQTGILGFNKVPFSTELFVKDRWTGIPATSAATQAQSMP